MKKVARSEKQGHQHMADHNIDALDICRVYYHPCGGMIELVKSRYQITITGKDGSSTVLSICPLGCIALGKALQAEGEAWIAADIKRVLNGDVVQ